ncbi:MAG: zf-HC2 domain-containing protein [Planctomycetota bacterium]
MTRCDEARSQLSALLDGELDAQTASDLRDHIESCDACGQEWSLMRKLDQQLRDALVLESPDSTDQQPVPTTVTWVNWRVAISVVGLAAILLFAVTLIPFKTDETADAVDSASESIELDATLVHATGPVEVYNSDADTWIEWGTETAPTLEPGSRLRTLAEARCEFQTLDNGKVRLDEDAELIWKQADEVMLLKGRMWCEAPSDQPLLVQLPMNTQNQIVTFVCPSRSESHYAAESESVSCTSTSAGNETVTAASDACAWDLSPGETLQIGEEQNVESNEHLVAAAKAWQLPLLALPGDDHAELSQSVTWLLAPVGYTKARHFNELQIRALGGSGAIPLLAYVRHSEADSAQRSTRRRAMRLALEIADANALTIIDKLRSDEDQVVAELAERIHERIQNPP